jgi:hypothetical protein
LGKSINAVATGDLTTAIWTGSKQNILVSLHSLYAPEKQGTIVGDVGMANGQFLGTVPVQLQNSIVSPPWWWRIFRLKNL